MFSLRNKTVVFFTPTILTRIRERTHNKSWQNSCNGCSNKAFPCLLWWKLNQRCSPKENPKKVGHYVIDYNQGCWKQKPAAHREKHPQQKEHWQNKLHHCDNHLCTVAQESIVYRSEFCKPKTVNLDNEASNLSQTVETKEE